MLVVTTASIGDQLVISTNSLQIILKNDLMPYHSQLGFGKPRNGFRSSSYFETPLLIRCEADTITLKFF